MLAALEPHEWMMTASEMAARSSTRPAPPGITSSARLKIGEAEASFVRPDGAAEDVSTSIVTVSIFFPALDESLVLLCRAEARCRSLGEHTA